MTSFAIYKFLTNIKEGGARNLPSGSGSKPENLSYLTLSILQGEVTSKRSVFV